MILHQFLDKKDLEFLINFEHNIQYIYADQSVAYHSDILYLKDENNLDFLSIVRKIINKFNEFKPNYKWYKTHSFFIRVKNNGYVDTHIDWVLDNIPSVNLIILLNKPSNGGILLDNENQVVMDVNDAYILNASNPHSLSIVTGSENYVALVLWFYTR